VVGFENGIRIYISKTSYITLSSSHNFLISARNLSIFIDVVPSCLALFVRLKFQKRSALKFVSRTTKYRLCRDDLMIPKTRENNPAEGGGFNTPQLCCGISFSRVLRTLGFL
jgi:hypothetical protein